MTKPWHSIDLSALQKPDAAPATITTRQRTLFKWRFKWEDLSQPYDSRSGYSIL